MTEIPTELKSMNRRTFLKKVAKMYMGLMGSGMLLGIYSNKTERFWYQIQELQLKIKNLPIAFKGWKIVHFSDIHLGFNYGIKELRTVIEMINNLNPDIILFTGDLIQSGYKEPETAIPLLKELKAHRGGKWAVLGNHDYTSKDKVIPVLKNSQFNVLVNNHDFIEQNKQRLYIAGIDDVMYGMPNIGKTIQGLSESDCVLLLAHEPDIADESCNYPISAQFSGHSHGGQVRMPFYGPIIRQRFASKYVDGIYQVGVNRMPLYVNRGIGTTKLAIRFFCRPEITVFHIK